MTAPVAGPPALTWPTIWPLKKTSCRSQGTQISAALHGVCAASTLRLIDRASLFCCIVRSTVLSLFCFTVVSLLSPTLDSAPLFCCACTDSVLSVPPHYSATLHTLVLSGQIWPSDWPCCEHHIWHGLHALWAAVQRLLKQGADNLRSQQYQLLYVDNGIVQGSQREDWKVLMAAETY